MYMNKKILLWITSMQCIKMNDKPVCFCCIVRKFYIKWQFFYISCIVVVRIPLRQGVLDTTLCDKVCQWLATGLWFSPGTPISSTNKSDHHHITKILLKVALNTIILTLTLILLYWVCLRRVLPCNVSWTANRF